MQNVDLSAPWLGGNVGQALALPNESILMQLDGFCWALVHAGPALNTILSPVRIRSLFFDFIDLAGTDHYAVSTAIACFSVHDGVHMKIANFKLL